MAPPVGPRPVDLLRSGLAVHGRPEPRDRRPAERPVPARARGRDAAGEAGRGPHRRHAGVVAHRRRARLAHRRAPRRGRARLLRRAVHRGDRRGARHPGRHRQIAAALRAEGPAPRPGGEGRHRMTAERDPYEEWDAAYVLGALSPAERREYETHLRDCERCSAAVADLAAVPPLLARVPASEALALLEEDRPEPEPIPDPLPHLLAAVRTRRRRRRFWLAGVGVALAAAVTAVLLVLPGTL